MAWRWVLLAAASGFFAVAAGAFASHTLSADARAVALVGTAAQYAMYHALALLAIGLFAARAEAPALTAAGWLFVAGIVLFSGSLVGLAATSVRALGFVTPVGGVAFLLGWVALGTYALKALR
jgi:uncharacterized membrane protein YgdD (TMEM256/DUF423 family)